MKKRSQPQIGRREFLQAGAGLFAGALAVGAVEVAAAPASVFPDLVGGLKETPGCLGVETARTASGKACIFAWFEDKKALLGWYYSKMHQDAMKSFFPGVTAE